MNQRIAILGAGAIGGAIGAYLIRDGHDVILIDQWAAHIEKMRRDGLKVTDLNGEFTVPAKALHLSDVCNLKEPLDIVYLSVKSYDTLWSTYLIEPYLKPTGFIISAQNALNDEVVASVVGFNRTIGCVPMIAVGIYEPGHVSRHDPLDRHCLTVGELSGLITNRVKEVAASLNAVGPSDATTNIWGARWAKLAINSMANALAGVVGPSLSYLSEAQRDTLYLLRIIIGGEVTRVGNALGVSIEPIWEVPSTEFDETTTMEAVQKLKEKMATIWNKQFLPADQLEKKVGVPQRPSLLQDIIKKRRTEVEYLNGEVVRRGRIAGVPTPMNEAILDLTLRIERGEANPDPSNLEVLKKRISL
ncbi:MAG TPA: 2-dehydropantoate 2-reductase [Dehalococcoidia bacterium]|nr:2-dehydropantoate 2-reductase [Dehalococcoidia bacterium]